MSAAGGPARSSRGRGLARLARRMALEAKMEGGALKSLKRSVLGGESLYVSTFTAPDTGGWVDVAAKLPGGIPTRSRGHGLASRCR